MHILAVLKQEGVKLLFSCQSSCYNQFMPRKLRLEYKDAFYHVMNRGRGRQDIFHDEDYFQAFLGLLEDVNNRFSCIIHGYCLMDNHYHLLLQTPDANLSRIMRHINGVYTQIYNRMKKTDGSLFRGRFKSILVQQDAYLLQLSRYIHRNPIDMKNPLVEDIVDYKWSSYRSYVNKDRCPDWLCRDFVYDVLGYSRKYSSYAIYVNQGVDDEINEFYSGKNYPTVVGEADFKQWVYDKLLPSVEPERKSKIIVPNVSIETVVKGVAEFYKVTIGEVVNINKRPKKENEARKVAMYLCQELTASYLRHIAVYFNLKNIGSVSNATFIIRSHRKSNQKLDRKINKLIKLIMSKAT